MRQILLAAMFAMGATSASADIPPNRDMYSPHALRELVDTHVVECSVSYIILGVIPVTVRLGWKSAKQCFAEGGQWPH